MKAKAGFRHTVQGLKNRKGRNDIVVGVFFKSFNKRVVKCWISDEENGNTFVGQARCNTEAGDTFDLKVGMALAMHRALDKREKYYNRRMARIQDFHHKVNFNTSHNICNKFQKLMEKEKLSCQESQ